MLKAIHAQENAQAAKENARHVVEKLHAIRAGQGRVDRQNGIDEMLSYYSMPPELWRCLRTNNPLERLMREIRRRTRVVGAFPDGNSVLMLVAARLRHVAATRWGTTLSADEQAGRGPGHRLTTLLLVPMETRSKTTSTQPSRLARKIESAKYSGHCQGADLRLENMRCIFLEERKIAYLP